jgi:hypothetical protein
MAYENNDVRISDDRDNPKHEPHFDVAVKLPEIRGADVTRVTPEGDVIGGKTQIGNAKLEWERSD